jgi:hypothetical protein
MAAHSSRAIGSNPGLQNILSNSMTGSPVASPNLAAKIDFPAPPAPTTTTRLTPQIVPHPTQSLFTADFGRSLTEELLGGVTSSDPVQGSCRESALTSSRIAKPPNLEVRKELAVTTPGRPARQASWRVHSFDLGEAGQIIVLEIKDFLLARRSLSVLSYRLAPARSRGRFWPCTLSNLGHQLVYELPHLLPTITNLLNDLRSVQ